MNLKKLQEAQRSFFKKYPGGFSHPDMVAIGKKHKMETMISFAKEHFKKTQFTDHQRIADNMIKIISRSSMVSLFEKPKFKDFVLSLSQDEVKWLSGGLKHLLHGNQEKGFNELLNLLQRAKLAKWSLLTIIPNYYIPDEEVFVKPTTCKGVISFFELTGLVYKPQPSWAFYQAYKREILAMKKKVDKNLTPNNAAFCGFLMMSLDKLD